MLAVMLVVFADVGMRHGFDSPLSWSHDVVTLHLPSALFFPALAASWRDGRHIRIGLLRALPDRGRAARDLAACPFALALTVGFGAQGALLIAEAWEAGRVTPGAHDWPSWASVGLMPLGMAQPGLRLGPEAVRHGRGVLGLAPVATPTQHDGLGAE